MHELIHTSPDGAVAMSSANGLVGRPTEFAAMYRLHPRAGFKDPVGRCKAITPFPLTNL